MRPTLRRVARQLPKVSRIGPSNAARNVPPPISAAAQDVKPQQRSGKSIKSLPIAWWISGFIFCATVGYSGSSFYLLTTRPVPDFDPSIDLNAVYDTTAQSFDEKVERTEYWWGILKWRMRLARMAKGDVLESAAGTGRNGEYFDLAKVKSLVEVDRSGSMLELCKEKWEQPSDKKLQWKEKVRYLVGDLADDETVRRLSPPDGYGNGDASHGKFDTVIQTLGLCSTNEPVKLLKNLGKLVKDDGKILLLEHGKGYFDLLNKYMDVQAPQHARSHGCWWNRDIGGIVEESGLEVVEARRYTFGTTWWYVLKRPPGYAERSAQEEEEHRNHGITETASGITRSWTSWIWR